MYHMAFFFREKFYQATQFLVIPYPLELLPKGEKKREKKKDPNMSHHVLQHRKIGKKKKIPLDPKFPFISQFCQGTASSPRLCTQTLSSGSVGHAWG